MEYGVREGAPREEEGAQEEGVWKASKDSALREERGTLLDAAERLREMKILNWAAVEAIGDFDRHSSGGRWGQRAALQ